MNDKLFKDIFTRRTAGRNGGYLIVSGEDRLNKGVCYRSVRNVAIRGCNTRVFRAGSGEI